MSETPASEPSSSGSQEFVVRASGSLHHGVDYFLAKFPSGFTSFKDSKSKWRMHRQEEDLNVRRGAPKAKRPRTMPWVLEDRPGHTSHIGQPEAGMTGSGAASIWQESLSRKCLPDVLSFSHTQLYEILSTFRPGRAAGMTLEEAEKQMNNRSAGIHLRASSRLGALAAKAEVNGEEMEDGDQEGEAPDSDEEKEMLRAARMRQAEVGNGADEDDNMPGAKVTIGVPPDRGEKGEDWEHEEERADDDLEQGDEEGSDHDLNLTVKKEKRPPSDPGSETEGNGLTEAGQELHRILQKARISSGSEDGDPTMSSDAEEENEEEFDDDVDLDEMASGLLPKQVKAEPGVAAAARGNTRNITPQPSSRGPTIKPGNKRKANTPPTQTDTKKVKPEIKAEPGRELKVADGASIGAPPTAQEILNSLRAWGPVTAQELTSRFKKRLKNADEKKAFTVIVKRISRLEERPPGSGNKFIIPK